MIEVIRFRSAVAVLAVVLGLCGTAHAEFPVSAYEELKNNERFKDYIAGAGRGIFWSNSFTANIGRSRLFCFPSGLSLDEGIIYSLLDQEIRRPSKASAYRPNTPLELILLNAFVYRFPCQGSEATPNSTIERDAPPAARPSP